MNKRNTNKINKHVNSIENKLELSINMKKNFQLFCRIANLQDFVIGYDILIL